MSGGRWHEDEERGTIPSWSGNPADWEVYKDEVRIWKLGQDFSVKYAPAARLVARLGGSARRVALSMPDTDLLGTETNPYAGVDALMALLAKELSGEKAVRKGESLEEFFGPIVPSLKYARKSGERVADWITRWDEGVRKLHEDGVPIMDWPDLAGFFFLRMATLTPIRRELVLTKVPEGKDYDVKSLKTAMIRLFPDLGRQEARQQSMNPKPGAPGRQTRFVRNQSQKRGYRSTYEAGVDDDSDEYEDEQFEEEAVPIQPADLQDIARQELEALSADVQEAADRGDQTFDEDAAAALEEATAVLAGVSDALETVRSARASLQGSGGEPAVATKGRGKGKSKGKSRGKSADKSASFSRSIAERKAKSRCKVCGKIGHWSGDAECSGTSRTQSTYEAAALDSIDEDQNVVDVAVCEVSGAYVLDPDYRKRVAVYMVSPSGHAEHPDSEKGVLDTACGKSVAGELWWKDYRQRLEALGLLDQVTERSCSESYRFGEGRVVPSSVEVEAPMCLGPLAVRVRFCIVPGSLCLLLGKDFIEKFGPVIDPARMRVTIGSAQVRLVRSANKHMAFELRPGAWSTLRDPEMSRKRLPDTPARLREERRRPRPAGGRMLQVLALIAGVLGSTGSGDKTVNSKRIFDDCAENFDNGPRTLDENSAPECLQSAVSSRARGPTILCHICGQGAGGSCKSCGDYVCRGCRDGVVCTHCSYGVAPATFDTSVPQVQEFRAMKKGTQKLHRHGLSLAGTMHDHGVRPFFVRQKLESLTDVLATSVCKDAVAGGSSSVKPFVLHEYGAYVDSAFGGQAGRAGLVTKSWGLHCVDLFTEGGVNKVRQSIEDDLLSGCRVALWVSLPCGAFSPLRNLVAKNVAKDTRKRYAKELGDSRRDVLKGVGLLCAMLSQLRGSLPASTIRFLSVVFEWPTGSHGWQHVPGDLFRLLPYKVRVDGCMFGLRAPDGKLQQKRWTLMTNRRDLQKLGKQCDGGHGHTELFRGRAARAADRYTPQLVRTALSLLMSGETFTPRRSQVQALISDAAVDEDEPVTDEALSKAVAHLHSSMGHPAPAAMARAVRLTGGSATAIQACLRYRCPVCARLREPKPVPKGKISRWTEFGQCVAVDLFTLADVSGKSATFINAVDAASGFQIVGLCPSKHPRVVYTRFCEVWLAWAGVPETVLTDMGGEFQREFGEELESMKVRLLTTPAVSPTQNSKCERSGGNWKFHAKALMDEFSVTFDPADSSRLAWLVMTVNWAMNASVNQTGYSPAQWVLGRGFKLPFELQSARSRLSLHSRLHTDRAFRERVSMTAAAQRSVLALKYHAAASRALLSRARGDATTPTELKYALGDQVYYWRGHSKNKSAWMLRWHGPAVVIGFEGSALWLAHRGLTVKASIRHVRPAEPEELIPWGSLLEDDARADKNEQDANDFTERAANDDEDKDPTDPRPPEVQSDRFAESYLDMTALARGSRVQENPGTAEGGDAEEEEQPPRTRRRTEAPQDDNVDRNPEPTAQEQPDDEMDMNLEPTEIRNQTADEIFDDVFGDADPAPPREEIQDDLPDASPDAASRSRSPAVGDTGTVGRNRPQQSTARQQQLLDDLPGSIRQNLAQQRADDDERQRQRAESPRTPARRKFLLDDLPQQIRQNLSRLPRTPPRTTAQLPTQPPGPPNLPGLPDPPTAERRARLLDDLPGQIRQHIATRSGAERRERLLDDLPLQIRQNIAARSSSEAPVDPDMVRGPPPEPKRPRVNEDPGRQPREEQVLQAVPVREQGLGEKLFHWTLVADRVEYDHVERHRPTEHWVHLVGRSASKELKFSQLSCADQVRMKKAMAAEWAKWLLFHAVKFVSAADYKATLSKRPDLNIVKTRWVLTEKGDGEFKARLVVVGCLEPRRGIRSDAPTGSQLGFHITLCMGLQTGWRLQCFDAATAFLQSKGISRLLLLSLPASEPPPGTVASQIVRATGSIYGTYDAGRQWYLHLRGVLESFAFTELALERGVYIHRDARGEVDIAVHSHVDDCLFAWRAGPEIESLLGKLTEKLHMTSKSERDFVYCGKRVQNLPGEVRVDQRAACDAMEPATVNPERRKEPEKPVTDEERTTYRSIVGQLLYLATWSRPDLAFSTSLAAQRTSVATVGDLLSLNRIVADAKARRDTCIVFRRGLPDLRSCTLLAYGDSAFANAPGEKSQCGVCVVATSDPKAYIDGDARKGLPLSWSSSTIKRVVRSTLSAEAYAASEASEDAEYIRTVFQEMFGKGGSLRSLVAKVPGQKLVTVTDSDNLDKTVRRDAGQCRDKRLRIVISMLRQTFGSSCGSRTLEWIPTEKMVADGLTKLVNLIALIAFATASVWKPLPSKRTAKAMAGLLGLPGSDAIRDMVPSSGATTEGFYIESASFVAGAVFTLILLTAALVCIGCSAYLVSRKSRKERSWKNELQEPVSATPVKDIGETMGKESVTKDFRRRPRQEERPEDADFNDLVAAEPLNRVRGSTGKETMRQWRRFLVDARLRHCDAALCSTGSNQYFLRARCAICGEVVGRVDLRSGKVVQ